MVLWLILLSVNAFAWDGLDYVTFFGTTDKTITVGWTVSDGAEKYELRLYNHERDVFEDIGETTAVEYTFQLPRSGHYTAQVRALCLNDAGTEWLTSTWSESTNAEVAMVNDNPRAWWIYGFVAPPGNIEPLDFYF